MNIAQAAARAADWLEANPDKHIARKLAIDANNRRVSPTDPTAECFCALGRLARELSLPMAGAEDYAAFEDLGIDYDSIYQANDQGSSLIFNRLRVHPAHPEAGIAALRKLV